ncbi:DNA ligase 4 [Lentinula aciculospora]|uniref:DNA ligase n=1 Tax=Lentinula aciculospora TaxID=153920 RepID=A0A9W9A452_9AGAR|nr:DNA ligase 4 [Lentinula aciculospora]
MEPTPAPTTPSRSPPPDDTPYTPAPQNNKGLSPPFGALVGLFERLQNERKQDKRKKLMNAWFNHWRTEVGNDLFPVLRLILPQKDHDRAVYGLKEKNLAKIYIKLIPLNKNHDDAKRLTDWKKPQNNRAYSAGDFPGILWDVVHKRSSVVEGTLNIQELNDLLDELSNSIGKQDAQMKILQRVYNRATAEEQRWIIRIILKDMVISVKETTVFSVFHPDAQDLYNACSDLKKVAWTLYDPNHRLNADDKTIQLFQAFTPMLCKRPTKTIEHTVKEMGGVEFIIEEKLDGERMQIHKRGNEYFYCSRKGKNYTYLYGKHRGIGSLTRYLDDALDSRVESIILDGEMLVWDPVSERNLPFGTLKTAALDKSKKENNPRPCFKMFDMLYLNGQSLLEKSITFRKKNMRACLKEIQGRVEFAIEYKGKNAKDVKSRMEDVMAARGEGLVIKHPRSKYVLNGRNADWIKVKPEYMEGMGETVDLLVVAGNYGTGSRAGGVSALICAVRDDRGADDEDGADRYSTFVRIGTGLSFADYAWIRSKPWKVNDTKNPPEWLHTAKKSQEDKGDMYLEPDDSFILKIKAAEIFPSDQYHIGYTMRFPRALIIRDDLDASDTLTASELLESIRSEKKRKMEDTTGVAKKKRKAVTKKVIEVLPTFQGPKLKDVKILTDIFEGLTFVVMTDKRTKEAEKNELVRIIHENGGTRAQIAANHQAQDLIVVYKGREDSIPRDVQLVMEKGIYDILKPEWVTDSVALGHTVPSKSEYFIRAFKSRVETDGYEADDPEEDDQDIAKANETSSMEQYQVEHRSQTAETEVKEEYVKEEHADWFHVDIADAQDPKNGKESDSDTEDDSDNADVAGEDVAEENDDDWDKLDGEDLPPVAPATDEDVDMANNILMGEDESAMEYDLNAIFKHLCFYLDSPQNAARQGMVAKPKYEHEINQSFDKLREVIIEHGGRIVDLDESKLTHILIDKRDTSRRVELMKRTSTPKHRRLIVSDYVQACVDEATLLNEEGESMFTSVGDFP